MAGKNGKTAAKKQNAKAQVIEAKAKDVMAVNQDGTMEPLTKAIPEIAPEETVSAPAQRVYEPVFVTQKEPMVKILYLDSAIETNEIPIGGGRVITGSGKVFNVTLSDFEGVFMTPLVMKLLKQRKFIVLDGLTDEQRAEYGVAYREGEIVKNEGMFDVFLTARVSEAAELFRQLCPDHREMVSRRIVDAFEKHDNRLTRDRIEALNEISKGDYQDGKGAFTTILQEINARAL